MTRAVVVLVAVGASVAVGAGLAMFGRKAVEGELAGAFGDNDAAEVAESLSVTDAMRAGLRKLAGRDAYASSGTVNLTV